VDFFIVDENSDFFNIGRPIAIYYTPNTTATNTVMDILMENFFREFTIYINETPYYENDLNYEGEFKLKSTDEAARSSD
jgi:hypothetical protein